MTVIQDTDIGTEIGQVELSDGWEACTTTCDQAADGSYQWTQDVDATATVRFSGTEVALFGVKEPWAHVATVSLDGGEPVDVDYYEATATDTPVEVFRSAEMEDTTHTLVLTMTEQRNPASTGGDAITFDRAEVTGGSGGEPPVTSTTALPPEAPLPSTAPALTPEAPATPGAAPVTGNLSGLTWASGYGDDNQTRQAYEAFGTWRDRPLDVAKVFPARGSWNDIVGPNAFIYGNFAGFEGRLVIAVPLFPESGGNLAECATGQYDGQWATFGRSMVGNSRGDSIVKLGWEFNTGHYWAATDTEQWTECFRRAATAIRSTAPDVRIDWTMNAHATPANLCDGNAWNCYPGDEYVDIVGIDDYDWYPPAPTREAFEARANLREGLNTVHQFAVEHGKWMSVFEWGVSSEHSKPVGGDNPLYIQLMLDWFAAHDVESGGRLVAEAYFGSCSPGNVRSSLTAECGNPNAAEAYDDRF